MGKTWIVVAALVVVALSGCSETPGEAPDLASEDDGQGTKQVGATGNGTTATSGADGEPRMEVSIAPSLDRAYIPYRASFEYTAKVFDAEGQMVEEAVAVEVTSSTLVLENLTAADGTIGFLVDQPGDHAIQATFSSGAASPVTTRVNATGLYEALNVTMIGGLETQVTFNHGLALGVTGGLGREDPSNFTFMCTWDAGPEFTIDGCGASVSSDEPGELAFNVSVTDGVTTVLESGTLTVGPAEASGEMSGGVFCYNAGGIGRSNVIALATAEAGDPKPKFVAGEPDISCSARSTTGPGITAGTPASFYVMNADGIQDGPITTSCTDDGGLTGSGTGYACGVTWDIPASLTAGEYELMFRIEVSETEMYWVANTQANVGPGGGSAIDIIGSPV